MVSHCATDRRFLHIPQLLHISHISVVRRQITNHANAILHHSPMKKKGGGTLAGIPRASGERNSPVGNGTFSNSQVSSASFIYGLTCPSLWYGFYIAISKLYDDEDLMVVESLTHSHRWAVDAANARAPISAFRLCRADQPCHLQNFC